MVTATQPTQQTKRPDARGRFGPYGGKFVPETLMPALDELEAAYRSAAEDEDFQKEFRWHLRQYAGRPTPLYHARRLTEHLGGAQIYLKREDLVHTGAHKINNTIGQGLLAKRMGKPRIIAETGAGQHGVATATVGALLGLKTVVYMGTEDTVRQRLNVYRMNLLGAEVRPVDSGSCTLKDAMNEAIRDWVTNVRDTYYVIGTVAGPHPYPELVRDFQQIIGHEAKKQCMEILGRLPDTIIACVGGGSNAIGIFHSFFEDEAVRFVGVEAAGEGIETGHHAAPLGHGLPGVLHGQYSPLLQNDDGQISLAHSVSAGLDYPGVGPEHAFYKDTGRAEYHSITDTEALDAFSLLAKTEGILPALESSHAIAEVIKIAPTMSSEQVIVVNLSGRGDKDVETAAKILGVDQ